MVYKRSFEDFLVFGKVISAALVLCGFLVLGLLVGRRLEASGWPGWAVPVCAACGAFVGAWQAWSFVKQAWRRNRRR